jgi:hypothetical protein
MTTATPSAEASIEGLNVAKSDIDVAVKVSAKEVMLCKT